MIIASDELDGAHESVNDHTQTIIGSTLRDKLLSLSYFHVRHMASNNTQYVIIHRHEG
jgi:hypothetical protein